MRPLQLFFTAALALSTAMEAAAPPQPTPTPPTSEPTWIQVSPSVTMLQARHGSNIACIALPDGLVFVDAGISTHAARTFRQSMEARFRRPTQALVLTHGHIDHILGMGAFTDVPVWAASVGRALIEQQLAITWDEAAVAAYDRVFPGFATSVTTATMFMPTQWFDDEVVLGAAPASLTVRRTGGHSVDSSHVVLASERVLVAGDLIQARRRPYFGDRTNDLGAWIGALLRWEGMEIDHFCPGHGPVIGRDEVTTIRTYFEQLSAALATLTAAGVPVREAVDHPSLPPGYWPDSEQPPPWWPGCIARAWLELAETSTSSAGDEED